MIGIHSLVRIKVPSSLKYLHSSCQRIPLLIFLTLMAATPNKTSSMAAPMMSECRDSWSVEFVLRSWMSSCKFQNYFDLYMLLWSIDSLKSTVKPVYSDNCVIRFPVTSSIGFHALLTIFYVSDILSSPTQNFSPSAFRIRQVSLYIQTIFQQEANGPNRSPEKQFQSKKKLRMVWIYHNID